MGKNYPLIRVMGRCLDFGHSPQAGSPAFIDNCDTVAEQQVGIEEFKPPGLAPLGSTCYSIPGPPTRGSFQEARRTFPRNDLERYAQWRRSAE